MCQGYEGGGVLPPADGTAGFVCFSGSKKKAPNWLTSGQAWPSQPARPLPMSPTAHRLRAGVAFCPRRWPLLAVPLAPPPHCHPLQAKLLSKGCVFWGVSNLATFSHGPLSFHSFLVLSGNVLKKCRIQNPHPLTSNPRMHFPNNATVLWVFFVYFGRFNMSHLKIMCSWGAPEIAQSNLL